MSNILESSIQSVQRSNAAWCRFITGNDTGTTGSHQAGFYIPKCASSLLFDEPGIKGENKEKTVLIKWQDSFITESCMKYYGKGTRNEYRITRFGRDFPFLQDDNVGDLLIIAKNSEEDYSGYVLSSDDDIDSFFAFFNLVPGETNQLIDVKGIVKPDERLEMLFQDFVANFENFPETRQMAFGARECYNKAYGITNETIVNNPDDVLLNWYNSEYRLFECMEEKVYSEMLSKPFANVKIFVETANVVLNRRKSRAGKSLEHHLADIFTHNELIFEEQVITEENKKLDFLFPNGECYHDINFPTDDLTILGVKTTCKDRWRQVLSEANRVEQKYIFTLQPSISKNQLKEMYDSHVALVVPQRNVPNFPIEYQNKINNLFGFINSVRNKQNHIPHHFLVNNQSR